ncbi:MAG: histidine--tRNA ligase [Leptospiraceae bacterium]|nr:histidine--tRNA ligase [Leptospiraceae bacterium]
MRFRAWMFGIMRRTVMLYGYEEYDAPLLESYDLYKAKTGEEIVGRQLYDFIDKGERHVAIRPEMTPSLARMVAAKNRDLPKPIRWYSIPNLWRYEAPGHGRLREHWQLNVDIFGINSVQAEVEIIKLACDILFAFRAPKGSFKVKISHRKILSGFLRNSLSLSGESDQTIAKILDKKNKITKEDFETQVKAYLPEPEKQLDLIYKYLASSIQNISEIGGIDPEVITEINRLFDILGKLGLSDYIEFDPSIIRGFDYYTGFIFEIFDTNPENKRSLYGGGRYDNLIGLFSNDELSGIGFGLGDVTLQNFLKSHNLIPNLKRHTTVFIPLMDDSLATDVMLLANQLRQEGISCEIMLEGKHKFGKQLALAEKKGYRYVLILGSDELQKGIVNLKDLISGEQKTISLQSLVQDLKNELLL